MAFPMDVDATTGVLLTTGATALGFGAVRTYVYFKMQVGILLFIWWLHSSFVLWKRRRDEITYSNVANGKNYVLSSSSSWFNSVCTPKMGITRVRWTSKNTASPFQRWAPWTCAQTNRCTPISPKGKSLGFHTVSWKYLVQPDTPTMIGWTIVVKCTENQVLGKSPPS